MGWIQIKLQFGSSLIIIALLKKKKLNFPLLHFITLNRSNFVYVRLLSNNILAQEKPMGMHRVHLVEVQHDYRDIMVVVEREVIKAYYSRHISTISGLNHCKLGFTVMMLPLKKGKCWCYDNV